jgi:hypothetical protein
MTRIRAIFACLYFGILPSCIYEKECHYERGYWRHLKLNIRQVWFWASFQETGEDLAFEGRVNASWLFICGKMLRWQHGAQPHIKQHTFAAAIQASANERGKQ